MLEKRFSGNSLYEDEHTDYSDLLEATNTAFGKYIRAIIYKLGLKNGMNVLDVGSGIGCDAIALAEAVVPEGKVIGLEIARSHIEKAVQKISLSPYSKNVEMLYCDIFGYKSPNVSYDLVWCKYTLACFFDPLEALQKMKNLTKPGGRIVLINDLCPMHWLPGTLLGDRSRESRIYSAIFEYINKYRRDRRKEFGINGEFNSSCAGLIRQVGCSKIESYTVVAEEVGHISEPFKKVVDLFLQRSFSGEVKNRLSAKDRKFVDEIVDRESPYYLPNRDDLHIIKPITALIGTA